MKDNDKPWLSLKNLKPPFNDATNYRSRQEKQFFNKIFLRTENLTSLLKPSVYYLIGEKGAGKTAYAAFLEANETNGNKCKLSTMTETQYKRFIALKQKGQMDYSDYAAIWRPMLLNMVAQAIVQKNNGFLSTMTGKFREIENEISEFNRHALNPEVDVAYEMTAQYSTSTTLGKPNMLAVGATDMEASKESSEEIRHHLLEKETRLKLAIGDLRLRNNHVLFVDGIDFRPESVPYADYINCVKGLGEAAWQLNMEYFSNIRDSSGRIKIVLLVRPDVFHRLNLYNANSKLRDNSVLLEWTTTAAAARSSQLYEAAGKYFSGQQTFDAEAIESADNYFSAHDSDSILKRLLRTTFQKPRDMLTFIDIARDVSIRHLQRGEESHFDFGVMTHPEYTRQFADYLLGEVRDYANFYMPHDDFDLYVKFFQYLNGKGEFTFDDFAEAFRKFKKWIAGETIHAREFLRDPEALLQFFYDVNAIGYRETVGEEDEKFVHFAFRERTLRNIAPKVKTTATLVVNPGIAKALDIGLKAKSGGVNADQPSRKRPPRFNKKKFYPRGKQAGNSGGAQKGQKSSQNRSPNGGSGSKP